MQISDPTIKIIDFSETDISAFGQNFADCIVMTHDQKILLQKRPAHWKTGAKKITAFGGHVETDETVMQGLIRELHEELGAQAQEKDIVFLGAITEDWTQHQDIVHLHFWHDREGTITGCYEAEAIEFETIEEALTHDALMEYLVWGLKECQKQIFSYKQKEGL